MSEDFRVVGMELMSNAEVELHEQEELEHLAKRKVISKELLNYNRQLAAYLQEFQQAAHEPHGATLKKRKKELEKMGELSKIDRIAILNNRFANESELLLKVPNSAQLSAKERKAVLEAQP